MPVFTGTATRISHRSHEFTVVAANREEAYDKITTLAEDYDFGQGTECYSELESVSDIRVATDEEYLQGGASKYSFPEWLPEHQVYVMYDSNDPSVVYTGKDTSTWHKRTKSEFQQMYPSKVPTNEG